MESASVDFLRDACDEIDSLRQQLAESQAREAGMREALAEVTPFFEKYMMLVPGDIQKLQKCVKALSTTPHSALDEAVRSAIADAVYEVCRDHAVQMHAAGFHGWAEAFEREAAESKSARAGKQAGEMKP